MPTPLIDQQTVDKIVSLYKEGYGVILISKKVNASFSTIRRIVRGEHPLWTKKLTTGIPCKQRNVTDLKYRNKKI